MDRTTIKKQPFTLILFLAALIVSSETTAGISSIRLKRPVHNKNFLSKFEGLCPGILKDGDPSALPPGTGWFRAAVSVSLRPGSPVSQRPRPRPARSPRAADGARVRVHVRAGDSVGVRAGVGGREPAPPLAAMSARAQLLSKLSPLLLLLLLLYSVNSSPPKTKDLIADPPKTLNQPPS